jgi:hypothetical protein
MGVDDPLVSCKVLWTRQYAYHLLSHLEALSASVVEVMIIPVSGVLIDVLLVNFFRSVLCLTHKD